MAETIINGQTCLEKRGMEERHDEIVRSDYSIEDQYGPTHSDAISNGDPQGKGTNHGAHSHWLPNCQGPIGRINYSNFDTQNRTVACTISKVVLVYLGRKQSLARSLYNMENAYGPTAVDTTLNVQDGQYFVGQQIGQRVK